MKALSIRQPWAELIVSGRKVIENREWKALPKLAPQPLAIHASLKPEPGWNAIAGCSEQLPLGCIVGIVWYAGAYWRKDLPKNLKRRDDACGPVCLLLEIPHRIEPFPCKGKLGFWNTPEEFDAMYSNHKGMTHAS